MLVPVHGPENHVQAYEFWPCKNVCSEKDGVQGMHSLAGSGVRRMQHKQPHANYGMKCKESVQFKLRSQRHQFCRSWMPTSPWCMHQTQFIRHAMFQIGDQPRFLLPCTCNW